ncbi:hypothetical protein [Terriglobus sp. TAA 43]|uniref:hypothetical protein n=1 Tax=Terriglobus sp. TAA 43 TaxID=278961 RepID=UPI000691CBB6|nr:hypothetical protein [Terriglobus sp. TAA 43]
MIRGLDTFKEHFAAFPDSYLMIGSVACHEWYQALGWEFRATKDLDIVILIEALTEEFVERFWQFIESGKYEIRQKADGGRVLYRFAKPQEDGYPAVVEVFSRKPEGITLWESQTIVPIALDEAEASLSAILLDDVYYQLILNHRVPNSDPSVVSALALIPLKAKAWLDLVHRKQNGERVDQKDIEKHRADVFRLAATLTGDAGPQIDPRVQDDMKQFLAGFPADDPDWVNILSALRATLGNRAPAPASLLEAIRETFHL